MTSVSAGEVTLALAAAASPAEAAGLALSPADLVAAGHGLGATGAELAAAVRALPAAVAEQAARALSDAADAEAVLAADRRKGVQLAVLAHAPLTLATRRRWALKTRNGEVGLAMAAIDGATPEQAVALYDVWEDMANQTILRLSDRLSRCRGPVVARLRAASPLGDADVALMRMARAWTADLADLELDPGCSDTAVGQLAGILTDPDAGALQVAAYTQVAARGLDVPSAAGLAAALDNGLDGSLFGDRAAEHAAALAAGGSAAHSPTLGPRAVAFVVAQQVAFGRVRVTVPGLRALVEAGEALQTGPTFDLEVGDADPDAEEVHLLVARLATWPDGWQFADTDAVAEAVRTTVAADPARLLDLRRPPARLIAEFADDPADDLQATGGLRDAGVGQVLAARARGGGVALTGASLATALRHLHDNNHLTDRELVEATVDAVAAGRLTEPVAHGLVLRQAPAPHRLPALAALPALAGDVRMLTDIAADDPGVTDAVVAAVTAHAPPSAVCHALVAHAVLATLRRRAAAAGRHPAEVLPTLAALLDGSWDGSLDDAVDAAVAVAPTAEATGTPTRASHR